MYGKGKSGISTRAPREGSDDGLNFWRGEQTNFYPRSPRGERLDALAEASADDYFYPRSPRGERRTSLPTIQPITNFYPRSPRGERPIGTPIAANGAYFYPRSPRGERPGIDTYLKSM